MITAQRDNAAEPTTVAEVQSAKQGAPPKCLADNTSLQVDADDRSNIEMTAVTQLTDVPAGTTTVVNIATYDGSKATGSELYPEKYGTYNFTAEKNASAADNQIKWKITSFTACER